MKQTFTTTIFQSEGMNATGLTVPPEVVAAFNSGKRPPVKVHIGEYVYQSTVASYGDVFVLPLSAENRAAAGVKAGDVVEVTLELDTAPRTVDVPEDLASELAEHNLTDVFNALAHSRRKEFVRQVASSKAQETRERRIGKIIAQLTEAKG
jgi:hypothetical protein